ncbi:FAD-dependent oxidoreductase [Neobacillus drentensis]|uniref:FAD-dependent oxidoreductase n=1 Tax=Neobacillus drentensis TaxID=220684 RepID=UPI000826876C|nr:FAD-dependent oxidoreductase [Neobacillus drentensis]
MEIYHYDVVCVGSGIAGMMASISAAERGLRVCVVSKDPIGWGNTRISGGIVTTNESNEKALYDDLLRTGEQINQKSLVKSLLSGSRNINDQIEKWGHIYLRNPENPKEKELVKPGGHTIPRTLKSSNRGISIANSLRSKFLALDIKTLEEVVVCEVMMREEKACGVLCYDWVENKWIGINAPNVILACGGAGMIYYPHSDNMRSSTGDGYALGLRAGARLIDMEQIQYIPFGILFPNGMKGLEVGDTSAAGPYGVLRNKQDEIVVDDLPNKTRELVARAIALEVKKGNGTPHGGLWLDPTENRKHEDGEKNWQHWKSIGTINTLKLAYGTKASHWLERFEVCPTQHYFMGGIFINESGKTEIPGLYAVGETAGGLHGAGRMGSMSLFDGLTFGKIVGEEIKKPTDAEVVLKDRDFILEKQKVINQFTGKSDYKPIRLKRELSNTMWENVGVIREEKNLKHALSVINKIEKKSKCVKVSFEQTNNHRFLELIELQFMIQTAKSVTISALYRQESRGSHYRSDYPVKVEQWQRKNVMVKASQEELSIEG